MRVTDLIVGDWVSVNGLNLKVGAIHADEIGVFDPDYKIYWCSDDGLDRIDPIPLTEEILVKNGFKKNDRGDFVIDDTIVIAKENYCPKNYYACTWYQEDFDDEIYYIGICELTFVHQLQHLLRLAGIEKEIEL